MDEAEKHDVKLIESGKDSTKTFQASEQSLYFVTALVHPSIIRPWLKTIRFRWYNGNKTKLECPLACLIAFVSLVHQHM
jgi:hypothetical protein